MKSIGNDCYLDSSGQLYITQPGVRDPFDPPGYEPPPVISATGYTYDEVPTYGWPLGIIYRNNPLQFATEYTAQRMLAECSKAFSGYRFTVTLDEVKVGPFTRAAIRKITARDDGGPVAVMNAGEMASQVARAPQSWQAQIARTIRDGAKERESWL